MKNDLTTLGTRGITTPQTEPIPGKDMAKNNAGGYSFKIDKWGQLRRFLILGSWGGTYYVGQRDLTRENLDVARACLKEDGARFVDTLVEVHSSGSAPKQDPVLYMLALASAEGNDQAKLLVHMYIPTGLRTATQLFTFVMYAKTLRGWGRGLKRAVAGWYEKNPTLALQVIKYRNRSGYTHRDLARLAHPKLEGERNDIMKWAVRGEIGEQLPELVKNHIAAQEAETAKDLIAVLKAARLPWESIPTEYLRDEDVMRTLIPTMPVGALVRQLGRLTNLGLETELVSALENIDKDQVIKARLHPLTVLAAINTYRKGRGERGSLTWNANQRVLDCLDDLMEHSYGSVEPTGVKVLLAMDVSSSMTWSEIAGIPGLTPRDASAALAAMYLRTEPIRPDIMAFSHTLVPVEFGAKTRIDDVLAKTNGMPFGGTDCALPMHYALGMRQNKSASYRSWNANAEITYDSKKEVPVDLFIVLTDSDTHSGMHGHAMQVLEKYQRKVNPNAKLVVVGMTSNGFTIADPNSKSALDVTGFDLGALSAITQFAQDKF